MELPRSSLAAYIRLSRPFTLIPPMLGMASGGVVAYFASEGALRLVHGGSYAATLMLGTIAAGLLNAASNAVNQIADLEIDRINKPGRPLCTGAISPTAAAWFASVTAAVALAMAGIVSWMTAHWGAIAMFAAATVLSAVYSLPPVRTKARGWLANLTVAIPRGVLLKVAGWSTAASIISAEAWYIGAIMGLFLLGATSTKDFADIRGDAAGGVRTLPIAYGPRSAARVIAPFLVLPFALIPIGGLIGVLTPPSEQGFTLWILGAVSLAWGAYTAALVLRDPDALTRTENHPAWRHMYYLMIFLQVGFALAYVPMF